MTKEQETKRVKELLMQGKTMSQIVEIIKKEKSSNVDDLMSMFMNGFGKK